MSATRFAQAAAAQRQPGKISDGSTLDITELVRLGTLAANSHNTQPWRFLTGEMSVTILPDFARRCPVVDPDDAHLWRSLGCAAENIVQAVRGQAHEAEVALDEVRDAVTIRFTKTAPGEPDALFHAIPLRQSVKTPYEPRPIPQDVQESLVRAGTLSPARCLLITDPAMRAAITELVAQGDMIQLGDPAFRNELLEWLRFNDTEAIRTGDGLSGRTIGQPSLPGWIARLIVRLLLSGKSQAKTDRRNMESSPAVAVIVAPDHSRASWIAAGRACQRLQLQATASGLCTAFLNQPVEVQALHPQLDSTLGLTDETAHLILRVGYGPRMPYSLRRPLDEVMVSGSEQPTYPPA
jgi:nitroreductase